MSDVAAAGSFAAVLVAAYAIGTFPTAVLVGRRLGFDPTTTGSGNPGAANATRVGGVRAGALVLAGDAAKGMASAGMGYALDGRITAWIVGAAAVAGHLWPATRRFRGGKGVATVAGVALVCEPVGFAVLAVLFGVAVAIAGTASVGSVLVAALVPVVLVARGQGAVEVLIGAALGAVIIVRHRSNIRQWFTKGADAGGR